MSPSSVSFDLTLEYLKGFVGEWFDQNPLGQIGVVGLRKGLAEKLVEMSGNPQEILRVLSDKEALAPEGEPSLQNGLEMARDSMRWVRVTMRAIRKIPDVSIVHQATCHLILLAKYSSSSPPLHQLIQARLLARSTLF